MTNLKRAVSGVITLLFLITITSCSNSADPQTSPGSFTDDQIELSLIDASLEKSLSSISFGDLSDLEKEGLIFMREEEKLARDVYLTLNEIYGLRVFTNISKSEQVHMNAVKFLLDRYEIEDSAEGNDIGEFTNPDLQALYNTLVDSGKVDEIAALKVGALIEETDIADLQVHIAEIEDNPDIEFVYGNLLRASTYHLLAFVRNLGVRGVDYEPQILDRITYIDYITD